MVIKERVKGQGRDWGQSWGQGQIQGHGKDESLICTIVVSRRAAMSDVIIRVQHQPATHTSLSPASYQQSCQNCCCNGNAIQLVLGENYKLPSGERAFSYCGPAAQNRLPHYIRASTSLNVFKWKLKTHLFWVIGHHCPMIGAKFYCLVTEAHMCEQLAKGHYLTAEWTGVELATSRLLPVVPACISMCIRTCMSTCDAWRNW